MQARNPMFSVILRAPLQRVCSNVRFWHKADIAADIRDVRFAPESGHCTKIKFGLIRAGSLFTNRLRV